MTDHAPALPAKEQPTTSGLPPFARLPLVIGLLYLFLIGVSLLEKGISGLGEGFQEGLLESVSNPVAGLCAGILVTVLVQSSSVSTSTIVGLVGSGTLTLGAAVPMIMGANIGTTVTNTLASLGHVRRGEEFRRAFAGATMHDFFNLMAVVVFLPIELSTRILSSTAQSIADVLTRAGLEGGKASSPIKQAVKYPAGLVEDAVAAIGLAPIVTGVIVLLVGLGLIFTALTFVTKNMRELVADKVEQAMNNLIGRGGGAVGIIIGMLVTIAVQSSSITTSILIPIVAAGVLTLRNAYPITLGANVGTTVTALIASLAVDLQAGLVIALTHTLFNISGIALFYPVRRVREFPIRLAEGLADIAMRNRVAVAVYVIGTFLVLPILGIAILR